MAHIYIMSQVDIGAVLGVVQVAGLRVSLRRQVRFNCREALPLHSPVLHESSVNSTEWRAILIYFRSSHSKV